MAARSDSDATVRTRLEDLLEVLGRTDDAMVAVDGDLRIVGWNAAAERLLGYTTDQAMGRSCHEVLAWRDRCGDGICGPECPAAGPGDPDEIVATTEVIGRTAAGRSLWLTATSIVPPPEMRSECRMIHLVREVGLPPELERLVVERLSGWSPAIAADPRLETLTRRERQVLELLADGLDGASIAEKIFVSPATVRNHVQHILRKLQVHSRLEAVSLFLRGRP